MVSREIYRGIDELVPIYNDFLREGYAKNSLLTNSLDLSNGLDVVRHRTSLVDLVLKDFFLKVSSERDSSRKMLFAAVGGYGRSELTPNSDIDSILLVEDISSDEDFVRFYSNELNNLFERLDGFYGRVIVNSLEDMSNTSYFDEKKCISFLDLRPIAGSNELGTLVRETLAKNKEMLIPDFVLNRVSDLQLRHRKRFPQEVWNVGLFNIKEGIGGLRDFHEAVWIRAVENYNSSNQMYELLGKEVLDNFYLLLKARSWLGLSKEIKKAGIEKNDFFNYPDFVGFENYFGEEGLAKLIGARKVIKQFAEREINDRLGRGIKVVEGIEYSKEGLDICDEGLLMDRQDLFYQMMKLSQTKNIPLSRRIYNLFLDKARETISPRADFLDLFSSGGNLSKTLKRLSEMRVLGNLIPGFSNLETSLYREEHRSSEITRERRSIERIENLENLEFNSSELGEESFFYEEYQKMDSNNLRNLRLALLIKEIPTVLKSNIDDYLLGFSKLYDLDENSSKELSFLIENKRLMLDTITRHLVDDPKTITEFAQTIQREDLLRSLLLFSYCDLDYRRENRFSSEQWRNISSLYQNTLRELRGEQKSVYNPQYHDDEGNQIIRSLPKRFFESTYVRDKMQFNSYIKKLKTVNSSKKSLVDFRQKNQKEASFVVSSPDFSGLLWRVAGTFYMNNLNIEQAQIYSSSSPYSLALDFFEVSSNIGELEKRLLKVREEISDVLDRRLEIDKNPLDILKNLFGEKRKSKEDYYRLDRFEDRNYDRLSVRIDYLPGTLYAISKLLSEEAQADILSITKYLHKDRSITRNFFFRTSKDLDFVDSLFSGLIPDIGMKD